jgi:hypothetical protein
MTFTGAGSVLSNNNSSTVTFAYNSTSQLCEHLWRRLPTPQPVPCLYLDSPAAASGNTTWTVAVPSVPTTQVLVVVGYALSSSWQLESSDRTLNATTTTPSVPMLRGELGYVSALVAAPSGYGAPPHTVALVARCAAEHVNVSVVVLWPTAPTVSTATVVATTLSSTVGAALGGDVASAASLVLLSALSCSTLAPDPGASALSVDPGASAYVMSVFYDEGPVAMVTGNVGLGLMVGLCQYALVCLVARLRGTAALDAAVALRFPAVSIRAADFLLPGTMYAALVAFWSAERGAAAAGALGVAAVLVALVLLDYVCAVRYVLPRCEYELYDAAAGYRTGHWLEARLLFPAGQWQPRAVRSRFWPMMGPYVPRRTWVRVVTMSLALLLAIASGIAPSAGAACAASAWVVGGVHVVAAFVLVVLRPYRVPSDAVLGPVGTLLVGAVCCLKASEAGGAVAVGEGLTAAMAVAQVVRTLLGLWVQWREGQWVDAAEEEEEEPEAPATVVLNDVVNTVELEPLPLMLNDDEVVSPLEDEALQFGLGDDYLTELAVDGDDEREKGAGEDPLVFGGIEGYFIRSL